MKDLKCGMTACEHNKGYSCVAKKIGVDKYADCSTYEPSEDKRRAMFEAGNDFTPANYSVDTDVACTAPCVFNRGNKCISNGITVMANGDDNDALCLTFIKN